MIWGQTYSFKCFNAQVIHVTEQNVPKAGKNLWKRSLEKTLCLKRSHMKGYVVCKGYKGAVYNGLIEAWFSTKGDQITHCICIPDYQFFNRQNVNNTCLYLGLSEIYLQTWNHCITTVFSSANSHTYNCDWGEYCQSKEERSEGKLQFRGQL